MTPGVLAVAIPVGTVNVEIFAQYIFLRISRSALDVRKYDVSEKMKHYRSNRFVHAKMSPRA